jgi:hypothetical protein
MYGLYHPALSAAQAAYPKGLSAISGGKKGVVWRLPQVLLPHLLLQFL